MNLYETTETLSGPILQVHQWVQEAQDSSVALPHAMNVASLDKDGRPSSRMVLLKRISQEGFVFFTDYEGNKGKQISDFPFVSLTFWWAKTNKQIRIEGECSRVSDKENNEYFHSRPRGSQISASVSKQSTPLDSYESLVKSSEAFEKEYQDSVIERPDRWGGFLVEPNSIEFWIDQKNRLHKRELFKKDGLNWSKVLLSP